MTEKLKFQAKQYFPEKLQKFWSYTAESQYMQHFDRLLFDDFGDTLGLLHSNQLDTWCVLNPHHFTDFKAISKKYFEYFHSIYSENRLLNFWKESTKDDYRMIDQKICVFDPFDHTRLPEREQGIYAVLYDTRDDFTNKGFR